jgi:hypothetical protein
MHVKYSYRFAHLQFHEQQILVKFYLALGNTASENYETLKADFGENAVGSIQSSE